MLGAVIMKCRIVVEEDQEQQPTDTNTLWGEKDTGPSETEKKAESLEWGEHCHQNVQRGSGPLNNSTRNSE